MTLNEVYKAAASGKRVYYRWAEMTDDNENSRRYVKVQHRFGMNVLVWTATDSDVAITDITSVPERWFAEDPKQYDFAEAFQLMKQGKRMTPSGGGFAYYFDGADWKFDGNVFKTPTFYPEDIDSKWIEVQS